MPEDNAIELAQRLEALEARNRELVVALEGLVSLFDAWRDGIFARIGVSWQTEPHAVSVARTLLKGEANA